MTAAKADMAKVRNPKKNIHLYINNSPGHINIAVAVQSYWKQLGLDVTIKTMEWKQYLAFNSWEWGYKNSRETLEYLKKDDEQSRALLTELGMAK